MESHAGGPGEGVAAENAWACTHLCARRHTCRYVHYSFYEIKFWFLQIFNDSRQRGIFHFLAPFLGEMGKLKPTEAALGVILQPFPFMKRDLWVVSGFLFTNETRTQRGKVPSAWAFMGGQRLLPPLQDPVPCTFHTPAGLRRELSGPVTELSSAQRQCAVLGSDPVMKA